MKKLKAPIWLARGLNKTKIWYRKNKPTIKYVSGTVMVVGGTVGACIATAKSSKIVEDAKTRIDTIKEYGDDMVYFVEDKKTGELTECAKEEALSRARKDIIFGIGKAFAIPAAVYGGGLALQAMGHKDAMTAAAINASLAAMYKRALDEYRDRVISLEGEELDRTVTLGEDPNSSLVEDTKTNVYSPLSIMFDETCLGWVDSCEMNKNFLMQRLGEAQWYVTNIGPLFVNDVCKMLGAKMTSEGQRRGWRKGSIISFGLDKDRMERDPYVRKFWNNQLKYVMLEFNDDGDILDELDIDPKTCNYVDSESEAVIFRHME